MRKSIRLHIVCLLLWCRFFVKQAKYRILAKNFAWDVWMRFLFFLIIFGAVFAYNSVSNLVVNLIFVQLCKRFAGSLFLKSLQRVRSPRISLTINNGTLLKINCWTNILEAFFAFLYGLHIYALKLDILGFSLGPLWYLGPDCLPWSRKIVEVS